MARKRLTWISPIGAANACGIALGAVMVLLLILFLALAFSSALWGHPNKDEIFPELMVFSLAAPFLYFAFGWVMGLAGAFAYNFTVRSTRGAAIEVHDA
jgi:hypothetical protein